MNEMEALFTCMNLMAGEHPLLLYKRDTVQGVFIWGRAFDEYQATTHDVGILDFAVELVPGLPDKAQIVIPGYVGSEHGQGQHGYPGPQAWKDYLNESYPSLVKNRVVALEGSGHNTKTEADDFLDFALEQDWKVVFAVTQYSHALRAMLGMVKSLMDRGRTDFLVYPMFPHRFNWLRKKYGSQGQGPLPSTAWISEEWRRIPEYQEQGDLCTFSELAHYLTGLQDHLATITA